MVRSRHTRGAVEAHSWCGRGTLVVQSRYARGAVWCASCLVRFVNFLSGDTVCVHTCVYVGPALTPNKLSNFSNHCMYIQDLCR